MADIAGINGQRERFRVVGKPNLPGIASYALAAGVAKFGCDYVLLDMLHAKILRSPYANAKVLGMDLSKARALPGVVDILTWEDPDIRNLGMTPDLPFRKRPWLDNYAEHEGEEVAVIVVAESEDICQAALRLIDVEWEVYDHVVDILKGREPDYPAIRPPELLEYADLGVTARLDPNRPRRGNVTYATTIDGDVDAVFANTPESNIIEYSLMLPAFASHIPNPPASVAWWEADPYEGEGKIYILKALFKEKR